MDEEGWEDNVGERAIDLLRMRAGRTPQRLQELLQYALNAFELTYGEYREIVERYMVRRGYTAVRQARALAKLDAIHTAIAYVGRDSEDSDMEGVGLLATPKAEDAGGLTHIYPLSRANVIAMCKHLI